MKQTETTENNEKTFEEKNEIAQQPAAAQGSQVLDTPIDVSSLPEDVRKQLIGIDTLELDQTLLAILAIGYIQSAGRDQDTGAIMMKNESDWFTVDKIVITLWINYQKKQERTMIIRRLRALVSQKLVEKNPKTMSVYRLLPAGYKNVQATTAQSGKAA